MNGIAYLPCKTLSGAATDRPALWHEGAHWHQPAVSRVSGAALVLVPEVIAPFGYYPALSTKSAPWVENRIHLSA